MPNNISDAQLEEELIEEIGKGKARLERYAKEMEAIGFICKVALLEDRSLVMTVNHISMPPNPALKVTRSRKTPGMVVTPAQAISESATNKAGSEAVDAVRMKELEAKRNAPKSQAPVGEPVTGASGVAAIDSPRADGSDLDQVPEPGAAS